MRHGALRTGAFVLALGCAANAVAVAAAPATAARPANGACRGTAKPAIGGLDLLELQISYTTLLARYYLPVDPAVVVRGAREAIASQLKQCGIADTRRLAYDPRQDGSERIDTDFLMAVTRYGTRVNAKALLQATIAGELGALHDPYTLLFRPTQFKAFNRFLQGDRFGGVGLVLDDSGARPRVATVIPGAPAALAGMKSGDVLTAIDGAPADRLTLAALRDALRGKPGTTVRLNVERDGAALPLPLVLTRAVVTDPQVLTHMIGADVGYVQLTRFGDGAAKQVADAVAGLGSRGATSYVLDLRDNGGGYGDAATGVASVFIASGTIYSTRERTGPARVDRASGASVFHAPLAVLVNHDTASAAEIVAGALQDDRTATIVGATTYGKGVVQSVFPLPDGAAIKMTTSRYFTPSGRSIDHVGIVPDIAVPEPADAHLGDPARDPQLARALAALAAATPAAVSTASAEASPAPPAAATAPGVP